MRIDTEPTFTVTALAAGTTTLTAAWRGVTATAEITVLAVTELPVGTVLWTGPTLPAGVKEIVQATTFEGERRLYAMEDGTGTSTPHRLVALADDGRTQWSTTVTGEIQQVSGTPLGGVAIQYATATASSIRVIGADGGGGIDVAAAGSLGFAIHPNGALYYIDSENGDLASVNIGMGEGLRSALPTGMVRRCTGREPDAPGTCTEEPGGFARGTPTILWDGTVVVPVSRPTITYYSPQGTIPAHPSVLQHGLSVFYLHPDGTTDTRTIWTPWPGHSSWTHNRALWPFKAIPDGNGGVIVGWTTEDTFGGTYNSDVHVARVTADGTVHGSVGPPGARIGEMVLGEDGTSLVTTYLEDGRKAGITWLSPVMSILAYEILANREVSTVMAEAGGMFSLNYSDGVVISSNAQLAELAATRLQPAGDGRWLAASAGGSGHVMWLAGPDVMPADTWWPLSSGSELGTNAAAEKFRTNYNAVTLGSTVPASGIFDAFVRTFDGVNAGNIATAVVPGGSVSSNGQIVTFELRNRLLRVFQGPFSVVVDRYSPATFTIVARTLPGHPLVGWRYWRVLAPMSGQVTIETGAFDKPAVGFANWVGFYLAKQDQTEIWRQYLDHILDETAATILNQDLIAGVWDDPGFDRFYIMTNVCGHAPAPSGFCQ